MVCVLLLLVIVEVADLADDVMMCPCVFLSPWVALPCHTANNGLVCICLANYQSGIHADAVPKEQKTVAYNCKLSQHL